MGEQRYQQTAESSPTEYPIGIIMRRWGEGYLQQYRPAIYIIKAIRDIGRCRTGWFGGSLIRCLDCGHERQFWHSCGNRNCPVCQSIQKEIWIDRRTAQLLPVRHFHMVFTLPHELNELIAFNKSLLLGALFKAACLSIDYYAKKPEVIGGQCGMIAVLHTWGSNMSEHNHLHTIVSAGGLNKDGAWRDSKKSGCFFERMTKVSKTFKRFYFELLEELYDQGKLDLSGKDLTHFEDIGRWCAFLRSVAQKKWVVHTKEPMNAVRHVIDYLARYVNRIAITNSRILEIKADKVVIRYKQYQQQKEGNASVPEATMELDGVEFVRRFAQHILPKGFQKCRYYGIYAPAAKKKLENARISMGNRDWCVTMRTVNQIVAKMIGLDPDICPHCSAKSRFEITNITVQRPDLYIHHTKVDTKCPRPPPGHEKTLVF